MRNPFREIQDLKSGLRRLSWLVACFGNLGMGQAQVPVHEEPRHHPVFENRDMRILDVHIAPGDTTLYHIHQTPSFFITLTTTDIGSQLQGKEAVAVRSTAGTILFENLATPYVRTHRVWNSDKETFHVMDVELLAQNPKFVRKPLNLPGLKLEVDTTWVRAYRLTLEQGKAFGIRNEKHAYLLVSLNASTAEAVRSGDRKTLALLPGNFFEVNRKKAFRIRNTSDNPIRFVLLELPVPL